MFVEAFAVRSAFVTPLLSLGPFVRNLDLNAGVVPEKSEANPQHVYPAGYGKTVAK